MYRDAHLSVKSAVVIVCDDEVRARVITELARDVDLGVTSVVRVADLESPVNLPIETSIALIDDAIGPHILGVLRQRERAMPLLWLHGSESSLLPSEDGFMPDAVVPFPCPALLLWQVTNALVRLPLFQGKALLALQQALRTTITCCFGAKVDILPPFLRGTQAPFGAVCATLAFLSSNASGTITLSGAPRAMAPLHQRFFSHETPPDEAAGVTLDHAALVDLAGELTNQVVGIFKKSLTTDDRFGVRVGLPIPLSPRKIPQGGVGMLLPTLVLPFRLDPKDPPVFLELALNRLDTTVDVGVQEEESSTEPELF